MTKYKGPIEPRSRPKIEKRGPVKMDLGQNKKPKRGEWARGGKGEAVALFREACRSTAEKIKLLEAWADECELRQREVVTSSGVVTVYARGQNWMKASENIINHGYGKAPKVIIGEEDNPIRVNLGMSEEAVLASKQRLFGITPQIASTVCDALEDVIEDEDEDDDDDDDEDDGDRD